MTDNGLWSVSGLAITELSLRGCQMDDSACQPISKLACLVKVDLRACEKLTGVVS